jgi:hypothetical protein
MRQGHENRTAHSHSLIWQHNQHPRTDSSGDCQDELHDLAGMNFPPPETMYMSVEMMIQQTVSQELIVNMNNPNLFSNVPLSRMLTSTGKNGGRLVESFNKPPTQARLAVVVVLEALRAEI